MKTPLLPPEAFAIQRQGGQDATSQFLSLLTQHSGVVVGLCPVDILRVTAWQTPGDTTPTSLGRAMLLSDVPAKSSPQGQGKGSTLVSLAPAQVEQS